MTTVDGDISGSGVASEDSDSGAVRGCDDRGGAGLAPGNSYIGGSCVTMVNGDIRELKKQDHDGNVNETIKLIGRRQKEHVNM